MAAQYKGVYVIKLVGDVRLTLCCTIDDYLGAMFAAPEFVNVVVDVTEAENIDSTSLGMMAKLAIQAKQQFNFIPVLICTNPNIKRLLESMSFNKVFDIREQPLKAESDFDELKQHNCDEKELREKVIEAHKVLMGLSEDNRASFSELVTALESSR